MITIQLNISEMLFPWLKFQRVTTLFLYWAVFYLKSLKYICKIILRLTLWSMMKGASAGHLVRLMFMHPRQSIWKTQVAEQIDHFDVSIHGTGMHKLVLILYANVVKKTTAASCRAYIIGFGLCLVVANRPIREKSIDGWLRHIIQTEKVHSSEQLY